MASMAYVFFNVRCPCGKFANRPQPTNRIHFEICLPDHFRNPSGCLPVRIDFFYPPLGGILAGLGAWGRPRVWSFKFYCSGGEAHPKKTPLKRQFPQYLPSKIPPFQARGPPQEDTSQTSFSQSLPSKFHSSRHTAPPEDTPRTPFPQYLPSKFQRSRHAGHHRPQTCQLDAYPSGCLPEIGPLPSGFFRNSKEFDVLYDT